MAKIGKSSEESSPDARASKGLRSEADLGGKIGRDSGPRETTAAAPGTLFWVTDLLEKHLGDNHPNFGIGYSGAFTIETATVEIKGDVFDRCDHFDELVSDCSTCGRCTGNNIRLRSGSGDGVYSGINYWAAQRYDGDDELNPELLASFYLFDDGNAHSNGIDARGWDSPMPFFFQNAAQYKELRGSIVGDVQGGPHGFWIGEASAHHGSTDAIVNHWGSENRAYRVIVFSEAADQRRMRQGGNSETPPMIPRILLILGRDIAETIFSSTDGLVPVDWMQQPDQWNNVTVFASIGGGDNTLACLANDGIYWLKVLEGHHSAPEPNQILSQKYQRQALGLLLQGALLGHQQSLSLLGGLVHHPSYGPFDGEAISEALLIRGWKNTDEAVEVVAGLQET